MRSVQASFLIHLLQNYLGDRDSSTLRYSGSWGSLEGLLAYHGIRPVFYTLRSAIPAVPEPLVNRLSQFCTRKAMRSLANETEAKRLSRLLQLHEIPYFFFKGPTFHRALYPDDIRESGDMDLLVKRENLREVMYLLMGEGYLPGLSHAQESSDHLIDALIDSKNTYEFPFVKPGFSLDLHWDLTYPFFSHKIPLDFIWSLSQEKEIIFWTLLNHHGGKELWLRLKGVLDFALFIRRYGDEMDWVQTLHHAGSFGMRTLLLNGFYILRHHLQVDVPPYIEQQLRAHTFRAESETFRYWESGVHWGKNPLARLKFEKILVQSLDHRLHTLSYWKAFYKAYSVASPLYKRDETNRMKNLPLWVFLIKTQSYLKERLFVTGENVPLQSNSRKKT